MTEENQSTKTLPIEIGRMSNHTEGLIHLNELLESAFSKLIGSHHSEGVEVSVGAKLSPSGLVDVINDHNDNIQAELKKAHELICEIDGLL